MFRASGLLMAVSEQQLAHISRLLGTVVLLTSLAVLLLGWGLGNEGVARLLPDAPTMKVNTALMLLIASVGCLAASAEHRRGWRATRQVAGILVAVIGLASIADMLSGQRIGLAEVILSDPWTPGEHAGEMSASTAVAGALTGLLLLLIRDDRKHTQLALQILVLALFGIVLIAAYIYCFDLQSLQYTLFFETMSIPTTFCILSLTLALILLSGRSVVLNQLLSGNVGGIMMRSLAVPILLVPLLLGYVLHQTANDKAVALATLAVASSLIMFLIVLGVTRVLDRNDLERQAALVAAIDNEAEAIRERNHAEAASMAKNQFLANFSHDLRTPLNAIIGLSELIKLEMFGKLQNERYADYVKDIHTSGRSLLGIIDSILDLAVIEHDAKLQQEETCDLRLIFDEIESIARSESLSKRINLESIIDSSVPGLLADPVMLKRIIGNLIANALKFTPPDGHINLGARLLDGDGLEIKVDDTGPGIDEETVERLLRPFEQGDHKAEVADSRRGLGLGLAISHRYADLHGATLSLENRPEGGLRASVVFPRARLRSVKS